MKILMQYINLLKQGLKNSKVAQAIAAFIVSLLLLSFSPYSLTTVVTPSIPMGIYTTQPVGELVRGQSYCMRMVRPGWLAEEINIPPRMVACKYLMGLPGDKVITKNGVVSVISQVDGDVVGTKVEAVREFKRLKAFKGIPIDAPDVNVTIPEGYYFFASEHEKGWDSRYIGLIKESALKSKVNLLYEF